MEKQAKRKMIENPYSLLEGIRVLWKNVRVRRKNPGKIHFIPKNVILNKIKPTYKITFLGDIMDLGRRYLEVSPELRDFIQASDFFVGNFEATITDEEPRGMDQRHDEKVIFALKSLFRPSKSYLSLANNHAGDFGKRSFDISKDKLLDSGFNIFGTKDKPSIEINEDIKLFGATMWINRPVDYITKLEDLNHQNINKKGFNILFPHWGYDLEMYPRKFVIKMANEFLNDYDVIIGSHSHIPEPITKVKKRNSNITQLLAYSLGDFCFGKYLPKYLYNYNYGMVLRVDIGQTDEDNWVIGNIEWNFTECTKKNPETMMVSIIDQNPYFEKKEKGYINSHNL